jgi:disulfide bond formation protein DsbB
MHTGLVAVLIPIIIIVVVALIILALNDRFAPDPSLKKIVAYVVYAVALIALILKLFPMLGFG